MQTAKPQKHLLLQPPWYARQPKLLHSLRPINPLHKHHIQPLPITNSLRQILQIHLQSLPQLLLSQHQQLTQLPPLLRHKNRYNPYRRSLSRLILFQLPLPIHNNPPKILLQIIPLLRHINPCKFRPIIKSLRKIFLTYL